MKRISIFNDYIAPLVPGVFRGEDKLTILSLIKALMKHMVTSVNGIEPDENGNVQIQASGSTVKVGTTSTLEPGNDATVTNSGSDTNVVLNFGIPKGDRGEQGSAGADGKAATIRVGNVTTLPAGSNATVVNSGNENNAVFDFGIPQGQPGSGGGGGSTVTVNVGTTSTLGPGEDATVTNSGTEENVVLNFGIPKGEKGEPGVNGQDGAQGEQGIPGNDGKAATVTVGTVSTLPAGSNATVVNVGTDTAAVLDFGIPQGQPGGGGSGSTVTVNVGTTTTLEPGEDATVTNSGTEENVVLNFGIPKGEKGEPGVNGQDGAQGIPGEPGTDGKDGAAATIRVGSVNTVDYSQEASVYNAGTENAAILNFSIPRGQPGENGADGARGEQGVPGQDGKAATVTVGRVTTLAAGQAATVTNSGTDTDAVLDFAIPRGSRGIQGQAGDDGQAASVSVGAVSTLPAGSNATVTNSGTSTNAVLNFGIPRGADGSANKTVKKLGTLSNPQSGKTLRFNTQLVAGDLVVLHLIRNNYEQTRTAVVFGYWGESYYACVPLYPQDNTSATIFNKLYIQSSGMKFNSVWYCGIEYTGSMSQSLCTSAVAYLIR